MTAKFLLPASCALATALLAACDKPKAAAASGPVKPYPLKTCLVSGEAFGGAMGEPVSFVHEGQEIKLCCSHCRPDFDKDPATFLAKLKK